MHGIRIFWFDFESSPQESLCLASLSLDVVQEPPHIAKSLDMRCQPTIQSAPRDDMGSSCNMDEIESSCNTVCKGEEDFSRLKASEGFANLPTGCLGQHIVVDFLSFFVFAPRPAQEVIDRERTPAQSEPTEGGCDYMRRARESL